MFDLKKIDGVLTMSSREIAELTGKRHDHVLRDIRSMLSDLDDVTAPNCGLSEYTDSTGRKLPEYNLDKNLTLTLVSGYSVKLRHAIIKRWQELETRFQEELAIEKQRIADRHQARLEAPDMTDAIKLARECDGKGVKPYHFSNEYDLVNRIVLGMTASKI